MTEISDADYAAIETAVMETARGRWFLAEYARRNRNSDTSEVLNALERVEQKVAALPLARPSAGSESDAAAVDRVRYGILEMADAIARTKAEIAAIRADGEDLGRFEEASVELDAIVDQTEKATSSILASAEMVQEVAWTLREMSVEADVCDVLDAKATEIYTACSFQDLTGQRTRKVIQVLRYLEQRVNSMGAIWTGQPDTGIAIPPPPHLPNVHRGADGHLLNGPSLPGEGLEQQDVDAMLGHHEPQPPVEVDAAEEEARIRALRERAEAARQDEAPVAGDTSESVADDEIISVTITEPAPMPKPRRRVSMIAPPPAPAHTDVMDANVAEVDVAEAHVAQTLTPASAAVPEVQAAPPIAGLPSQQDIEKLSFVEKMAVFS